MIDDDFDGDIVTTAAAPGQSRPATFDVFSDAEMRSALFKATTAIQKLEAFCANPGAAKVTKAWSRRREAIAVSAAADRVSVFEENIAGMGGEALIDINSKADRLAGDILEAMNSTDTLMAPDLTESGIRTIWEIADQSNIKIFASDSAWRLERDCAATAAETLEMSVSSPWSAAEAVRKIWVADRFDGIGHRMTLVLAAPIARSGFGVRHFVAGIAGEIAAEAERREEVVSSPDDFFVLFCRGIDRSATAAREAGQRLKRLAMEFTDACGPQREGRSRTGVAIEAVIANPIFTPQALRMELGTTDRGAEHILEKLLSAGCIAEHETSTRRNRTFICRKALNLSV